MTTIHNDKEYVRVDLPMRNRPENAEAREDADTTEHKYSHSSPFNDFKNWAGERLFLISVILFTMSVTSLVLHLSGHLTPLVETAQHHSTRLASVASTYITSFSSGSRLSREDIIKDIYSTRVIVPGFTDPHCKQHNSQIYTCSGYCAYLSLPQTFDGTLESALVKCQWEPRIVAPDLAAAGMYCVPPVDYCPEFNAFDKDRMPGCPKGVDKVPKELESNFTLGGVIPIRYEGYEYRGLDLEGWKSNADTMRNQAAMQGVVNVWDQKMVDDYMAQTKARQPIGSYGTTDIYQPMDDFKDKLIKGKKHAVLGSERPWIESILLYYGAQTVTCVEYGKIVSKVPNLYTITPMEYEQKRKEQYEKGEQPELFDSIWSYSSLEHDGLGRYGDPLNPYGDMQTMVKTSCMLKPGGFLFLALPTQKEEALVFNLHRIYGPVRWPYLYRHFHLIKVYGVLSDTRRQSNQPIFVFQNKIGCRSE